MSLLVSVAILLTIFVGGFLAGWVTRVKLKEQHRFLDDHERDIIDSAKLALHFKNKEKQPKGRRH